MDKNSVQTIFDGEQWTWRRGSLETSFGIICGVEYPDGTTLRVEPPADLYRYLAYAHPTVPPKNIELFVKGDGLCGYIFGYRTHGKRRSYEVRLWRYPKRLPDWLNPNY